MLDPFRPKRDAAKQHVRMSRGFLVYGVLRLERELAESPSVWVHRGSNPQTEALIHSTPSAVRRPPSENLSHSALVIHFWLVITWNGTWTLAESKSQPVWEFGTAARHRIEPIGRPVNRESVTSRLL